MEINVKQSLALEPKYEMGQVLEIRTLNITLPVIITKRTARVNVDTHEVVYYYNFKHNYNGKINGKEPWSWSDVDQENLEELMWYAKNHKEKQ